MALCRRERGKRLNTTTEWEEEIEPGISVTRDV